MTPANIEIGHAVGSGLPLLAFGVLILTVLAEQRQRGRTPEPDNAEAQRPPK